MTRALAGGMLSAGYEPSHILISEPLVEHRNKLGKELPGVVIFEKNEDAVRDAECVLLAVKPQILCDVCRPLASIVQTGRPLIISIAAGVRAVDIEQLGGPAFRVYLPMNTPRNDSCAPRRTSFRRPDRSSRWAPKKTSIR